VRQRKIEVQTSKEDADIAYILLPEHPGRGTNGAVATQVRLSSILSYKGSEIYLDLDRNGQLIGLEILA
jgi:uncharacterized protein YuzE